MKRVIISGAAGFIGNAVAREFISRGVQVIAVVKPGTEQGEEAFRLKDLKASIIECDLREIENLPQMIGKQGYDVFYQFAWDGVDKEAFEDYERQIDNIRWVAKSIEAAANLNCRKYIGAGSITQMELMYQKGRFFTGDRHKFYRAAQLSGEVIGRAIARERGMEFLWPIIINVYGEGEIAPRLVNSVIRNLLAGKKQSFSSGEQLYDFLHILDAAKAFCLIGEKGKGDSQYVIGSGKARPLKDYLTIIRDLVAPKMKLGLGELEFQGVEMPEPAFNIGSLVSDTGFMPEVTFEEGVKRTLEWIKKEDEKIDNE